MKLFPNHGLVQEAALPTGAGLRKVSVSVGAAGDQLMEQMKALQNELGECPSELPVWRTRGTPKWSPKCSLFERPPWPCLNWMTCIRPHRRAVRLPDSAWDNQAWGAQSAILQVMMLTADSRRWWRAFQNSLPYVAWLSSRWPPEKRGLARRLQILGQHNTNYCLPPAARRG